MESQPEKSSVSPATSLLVSDVILRGASHFARHAAEKAFLGRRFDKQTAKQTVEERSLTNIITAYGITRIATRSVPGAVMVSGGLIAKALYDRSEARRARKRAKRVDKSGD